MKHNRKTLFMPGDKKAIAFLLVVLVLAVGAFVWLGGDDTIPQSDDAVPQFSKRDTLYPTSRFQRQYQYYEAEPAHELFPFDPNTADSIQLLRLGLQPYQVKNIYRYRSRGGIFRSPADFARLYGLTQKQYRELEPFIRISDDYLPAAALVDTVRQEYRDTTLYPRKLQPTEHLELNHADTTALRRVPGIGRYYAREIDYRRRQLGGFIAVDQLMEIENFPEEALEYFTVDTAAVVKMNLNRLTLNQLKRHPYMGFYRARAICDYRRLKGPLTSLDDLRLIKEFSADDIRRLQPYVEF